MKGGRPRAAASCLAVPGAFGPVRDSCGRPVNRSRRLAGRAPAGSTASAVDPAKDTGRLRLHGHRLLATLGALPPFRQGRGLPSLTALRPPRLILAVSFPGVRHTGRVAYDMQPACKRGKVWVEINRAVKDSRRERGKRCSVEGQNGGGGNRTSTRQVRL